MIALADVDDPVDQRHENTATENVSGGDHAEVDEESQEIRFD